MATEYTKYYFYLTDEDDNTTFNVLAPNNSGIYYEITARFNQITSQWYCKITEYNGTKTMTTEWKRIVNTISLNIEYRNVMTYCIGCEGNLPYSPDTLDAFNDQQFRFFLIDWNSLTDI